jgi:KDO2-lipid IV(A) lauroyltransferase
MYMLDFLRLGSTGAVQRGVYAEGWEHLDAALARGRGVIVVAAHFGSWDRAAALLQTRGLRAHVLVDRFEPPALDAVIQQVRAAHGLSIIPAEGGAALRAVYAALRRNEIVILVADRPQREKGTPVTFFGQRAWLPSGPAMLARRTGATLMHAYLLRRPDLRTFQGAIEPPIEVAATGDRHADEQAIMQAVVDRLQRLIQQHPDQWYMFRPMWSGGAGQPFAADEGGSADLVPETRRRE